MTTQANHPILDFWFGTLDANGKAPADRQARWWQKSDAFDALCKTQFEDELKAAVKGERDQLKATPRGSMAFILLCDQMSRNIYRDTPGAFATDPLALAVTLKLIEDDTIEQLAVVERSFAYMPLMHSEDAKVHEISIERFTRLKDQGHDTLGFAQKHQAIIDRFGRYPHRNAILGRDSTPEELAFLQEPDSSF